MPNVNVQFGEIVGLKLDDPVLGKLDENRLDETTVYTTVPQGVFSVSTVRGRDKSIGQTSAGSLSLGLRNEDRFFDPLEGDFAKFTFPRLPIRVSAERGRVSEGGGELFIVENGIVYVVHKFFENGLLVLDVPLTVEYLVVGGGGAGGASIEGDGSGGGGGGGGVVFGRQRLPAGGLNVAVGAGGLGAAGSDGQNGGSSSVEFTGPLGPQPEVFFVEAFGGGGGGSALNAGLNGGSGGGGGGSPRFNISSGGLGTEGQGNNGGIGTDVGDVSERFGGGGGGATTPGQTTRPSPFFVDAPSVVQNPPEGGRGFRSSIGESFEQSFGGGGGGGNDTGDQTGFDGGGSGGLTPQAGGFGTGGGGGGAGLPESGSGVAGADGGSGVVIVRYPVENPLFEGFVDDWEYSYDTSGRSEASVVATDTFSRFARQINSGVLAGEESTGARLNRVLDQSQVNYSGFRDIDTGNSVLAEGLVEENVLEYMLDVVEKSEQGFLFMASDGTFTFRERLAVRDDVFIVSFGGDEGVPFQQLQVEYGSENLVNQVIVVGPDGTVVREDLSSQVSYGLTSLEIETQLANLSEQENLADFIINRFSEPEFRIASLTCNLRGLSEGQIALLLALDIGDPVNVFFKPNNVGDPVEFENRVIGVSHEVSVDTHLVTFNFEDLPEVD